MELKLVRRWLTEKATIGELYIDGVFQCYTCEDKYRADGKKVFGATAIPCGRYEVVINFSPRFKVDMPLLLDVPQFQGIRIHPGNKPEDTEGCILVGRVRASNMVLDSRHAYGELFLKLSSVKERIFITIEVQPTEVVA